MRKLLLTLGLVALVISTPFVGFSEEQNRQEQSGSSGQKGQNCRVERYQCGTKEDCRDVYVGHGITTRVCTQVPIYCERTVCD